jgi:chitinase
MIHIRHLSCSLVLLIALIFARPLTAALIAPTNATASATSTSTVDLRWTDTNSTEFAYLIERSASATVGFVEIARIARDSVSFTNTGLAAATTYYYRVRATSGKGHKTQYSAYSGVVIATTQQGTPPPPPPSGKWVSAFYTGYDTNLLPLDRIDFGSLTHLMVSGILPQSDGSLDTRFYHSDTNAGGAAWAQSVAQATRAAGRKAIVMVGGAGADGWPAPGTAAFSTFLANLVQFCATYGFDGIDIDEESGRSSYLPTIISGLKSRNSALILTVDAGWVSANFPDVDPYIVQVASQVDQVNVMSYAMADNWGGWTSWHSSALTGEGGNHPSSVASTLRAYVNAGINPSKLGMGIGFFGIGWGLPITAPLQTLGSNGWVKAGDNTLSYANIVNRYLPLAMRYYDSNAQAPFLSATSNVGPAGCSYISYEDEQSVTAKGAFAKQNGYGGTIIWTINQGYNPSASNPNSLIQAVANAFLR